MTSVAINTNTDELQFIEAADPEGDYACVECREPCEYVRSHTRDLSSGDTTRVKAYFRLSNCTCGSGTPGSSNGGGGGGGGGGETPLHERRKAEAMNEATDRFDIEFFDTEVYIGEKRADAVVEFANGHEDYGKGLVIEYQHKNEGKDIEATEQHFAQHEYTTVWLWEEQFTFGGNRPDIDLFGGRVYTPWPDAVPPESEWWQPSDVPKQTLRGLIGDLPTGYSTTETPVPTDYYDDHARDALDAYWDRLFSKPLSERYADDVAEATSAPIPAKLPNKYYDEQAQRIFGKQLWPTLFREWDGEYDYKTHTMRALIADLPNTEKPNPTLPGEIVNPSKKEVWREFDWDTRFSPYKSKSYIEQVRQHLNEPSVEAAVPIAQWIGLQIRCEHCGTELEINDNPDVSKMSKWSTNCAHCGGWTTIYDSSNTSLV